MSIPSNSKPVPKQESGLKIEVYYNTHGRAPDIGETYFHCNDCLAELPGGLSPKAWSRQQISITPEGFQVWCTRHDKNIAILTLRAVTK